MKFKTAEANTFFKIAILIEKNIIIAKNLNEKAQISNEELLILRKSIFELSKKNHGLLNNNLKNILNTHAKLGAIQ